MRFRVTYHRPADLLTDNVAQFQKGGLLVRVEPPPELALYDEVELEVASDFAATVLVRGTVVQLVQGGGVAIAFLPAAVQELIATAGAAGDRSGAPPSHERATPAQATRAEARPAAEGPAPARPGSDAAARIHTALYGNKDDRMRVMRDVNKMLHPYVLRNPGLGIDEVLVIAKLNTVAPDLLATIAERREWAQRPEIAIALVRNPKTPTPAAVRLLDYVSAADLRQLAKDTHTRPAVQQAARKKVLG